MDPNSLAAFLDQAARGASMALAAARSAEDAGTHTRTAVDSATRNVMGVLPAFKKVAFLCIWLTLLGTSSTVQYGMFYVIVIPPSWKTEPIHLDYRHGNHSSCAVDGVEDGRITPAATLDLLSSHTQWTGHVDGVTPPSRRSRVLEPSRHYFMDVAMLLPQSEENKKLGVFMVEVDLMDGNGGLLASSRRPCMLPHQSGLVAHTRKIFLMIPLLIGAMEESTTVIVKSFNHFIDWDEKPLSSVAIRLIHPQTTNSNSILPTVQVIKAELRIGEELNVFQSTMKEWFYTCAVIGIALIMAFDAFILSIMFALRKSKNRYDQRTVPKKEENKEERAEGNDMTDLFAQGLQDFADSRAPSEQQRGFTGEWGDSTMTGMEGEDSWESSQVESVSQLSGSESRTSSFPSVVGKKPHKVNTISNKEEEEIRAQRVLEGRIHSHQVFSGKK